MITLGQAIELATEAHKDQFRKPVKVFPVNEHTLENNEITKLQQNNGSDFSICKKDGKYTMDIHLQLFIAKPYITHPLAVMEMMITEEEKIVAVLHDVFENSNKSSYYLSRESKDVYSIYDEKQEIDYPISKEVYSTLLLITKTSSESYKKYVERLTKNKLAVKVKIADMMHNMSESNNPKQKEKYLKALPILLKAL